MVNDNRLVPERLMTPAEVAAMFGVNAKTPIRWANAGKLPSIKTPGGQNRFRESDVRAFLNGGGQ